MTPHRKAEALAVMHGLAALSSEAQKSGLSISPSVFGLSRAVYDSCGGSGEHAIPPNAELKSGPSWCKRVPVDGVAVTIYTDEPPGTPPAVLPAQPGDICTNCAQVGLPGALCLHHAAAGIPTGARA